jgi:hypothetical protein
VEQARRFNPRQLMKMHLRLTEYKSNLLLLYVYIPVLKDCAVKITSSTLSPPLFPEKELPIFTAQCWLVPKSGYFIKNNSYTSY